jgi:hypothetical protein
MKKWIQLWVTATASMAVPLCCAVASGQESQGLTPSAMLADQFYLRAGQMLRSPGDLRDDQRVTARVFLELALQINPRDIEAWLLLIELARESGQTDVHKGALQKYLGLVPGDDVARLKFIHLLLEELPTLEARIEKIHEIVASPAGGELSVPLRSRLASYCAHGAREMADESAVKRYLGEALKLDKTNFDAAQMLYELVAGRNSTPLERGLALIWCIRAQPLAVEPRRLLASLLLEEGAFEAAATQFQAAQGAAAAPLDARFYHDWALSLAATGTRDNTFQALRLLSSYEAQLAGPDKEKQKKEEKIAEEIQPERPADFEELELPQPTLPLDVELLRLAIMKHAGMTTSAEAALGRIRNALRERHGEDEQSVTDQVWLTVWLGSHVPEASVQRLEAKLGADHPLIRRVHGWMALRERRLEEAAKIFESLKETDPFAIYGLAHSLGKAEHPRRLELLRHLVKTGPTSLLGLVAARDLVASGQPHEVGKHGGRLNRLFEEMPEDIRSPASNVSPWTFVKVEVFPKTFRNFQPITARITLQNNSDVPLAFKPDGTLPTEMFLYLRPSEAGKGLGTLPPIVIDMRRRLRLDPGEQVQVFQRLDRSDFGMGLHGRLWQIIRFNVFGVLDPMPQGDGSVKIGQLGARASEFNLVRIGEPLSEDAIVSWLAALDEPNPVRRMRTEARLVIATSSLAGQIKQNRNFLEKLQEQKQAEAEAAEDEEQEEEAEGMGMNLDPEQLENIEEQSTRFEQLIASIGSAFNERYPEMDRTEQAWVVLFIPRFEQGRQLYDRVFELARQSKDPLVRIAYLAVHVNDPEGDDMTSALAESDVQISTFSQSVKDRFAWILEQRKKRRR